MPEEQAKDKILAYAMKDQKDRLQYLNEIVFENANYPRETHK